MKKIIDNQSQAILMHGLNKNALTISMVIENLDKNNFSDSELAAEMDRALIQLNKYWTNYKNQHLSSTEGQFNEI
jgi:hypothetical protein